MYDGIFILAWKNCKILFYFIFNEKYIYSDQRVLKGEEVFFVKKLGKFLQFNGGFNMLK